MPSRDWRTGIGYEDTGPIRLRDLAWEFLRRNPEFQAELIALGEPPPDDHPVLAKWGLRFRR